ncbi:MAG: TetR/AcrR family transcriptional regulator [archaeon]
MDVPLPVDPDGDTRLEILAATYAAIDKHGYAALSMQHIADEFPKSKSLLYHHYDGKDDLLLDFLQFLQSRFETVTGVSDELDPSEQLAAFLDIFVPRETTDLSPADDVARIYVQLRAQAVHDQEYAAIFREGDERIYERLCEIVRAGIEAGAFDPSADPESVAHFLRYVISGTMVHRTTGDEATPSPRRPSRSGARAARSSERR